MSHRARLLTLVLLSLSSVVAVAADVGASWRSDLLAWRSQREQQLATPDGWLTLVGLEWIQPGANSFGAGKDNRIQLHAAVPAHLGVIELSGNQLRLTAPSGGFPAALLLNGQPARAGVLASDDQGKPTVLKAGTLTLTVIHRGDRYAMRVKDASAPTRIQFHGLHWYPANERYRVEAQWIPWTPPHPERIATVVGTTLVLPVPGVAEFSLDGHKLRLEPVLEGAGAKELFFILRDTTSFTTSYHAARFLYTGLPDHGLDKPGKLVLDFNRLENPPCAYTPYATCPLPPAANRLAIALPVGEAKYAH